MTETHEPYITEEPPAVVIIEPPWELTPQPEPLRTDVETARSLIIEMAVKLDDANDATMHANKANGNAALGVYLDTERQLFDAVKFYKALTMPIKEAMEELDDMDRCYCCGARGGACSH